MDRRTVSAWYKRRPRPRRTIRNIRNMVRIWSSDMHPYNYMNNCAQKRYWYEWIHQEVVDRTKNVWKMSPVFPHPYTYNYVCNIYIYIHRYYGTLWHIMLQCSNLFNLSWFSHDSCQAEAVALGLAPAPPSEPSEPSKPSEPTSEPVAPSRWPGLDGRGWR